MNRERIGENFVCYFIIVEFRSTPYHPVSYIPCVSCVRCTLHADDRRSLTCAVNYITANDVKQESSARSTVGMCEIIRGISFQWSLRTDSIGYTALTNYATISPLRLDDLSSCLGLVIKQRPRVSSCSLFTNVQLQAYNGA